MRLYKSLLILFFLVACQGQDKEENSSTRVKMLVSENLVAYEEAPKFSLKNLNSEVVSNQSLKGKFVMLNFWATWCAPCVFEMPSLERLYQKYRDQGLEIVAINVDPPSAESEVRQFVKLNGLSFQILLDQELSTPPEFGVGGFPETIFLNREGKIVPFLDPETSKNGLRVLSDRPWDSDQYLEQIGEMLK